ncbi:MAG: peptidylprolyl isomerase [Bacteroidales bacterium]|nr:peptidylprolyl isomerase [Bacteroidales bacterium]
MKIKLMLGALIGGVCLAFAAQDPVLMTINGKDIHLSEFEYLYKKNNQQQVEKETLDQYVNRFVTYKQKVADAEAMGIDTLKSFVSEFNGYKEGMVKDFLEDTTINVRLEKEAYERMKTNVDLDHIMLPLGKDQNDNKAILARLDSIRTCVLNGEDWGALAKKFSTDPSAARNEGHYGFTASGIYPYGWEMVAYTTPIGQICKPFRTDFGNHLIRVNGKREDPGQVEVQHIMLLTRNMNDSAKAAVKARIYELYDSVKAGADFDALAKKYSDDKGSATKGGKLPWFGVNRMVPEFEKASFALADGEISEPIETVYGYHIIKKLGHKGVPSFEEALPAIKRSIAYDERSQMARNAKIEEIKKLYNYKSNDEKFRAYLKKELKKHGQFDSAFVAGVLAKSNFTICSWAGKKVPASVLAKSVNKKAKYDNESAAANIAAQIEPYVNRNIMQYYVDNLINDNAEYRNLINEYRDGMLLFEISNKKVWDGASKDTTGLKNYFEANRAKYNWDKPRFKGILLSAKSDSIAKEVKAMIPSIGADTLTTTLHKKFGSNIKMERMLFAQGENDVVDAVVFGKSEQTGNAKFPVAFVLEGGLIDQPETVADVKGAVTSDYQDVLEKAWLEQLKKKYPAKINKNVLKLVKP